MADAITAFGSTVDDGDSGFNIRRVITGSSQALEDVSHAGASTAAWQAGSSRAYARHLYTVATTWTPTAGLSQSATLGFTTVTASCGGCKKT